MKIIHKIVEVQTDGTVKDMEDFLNEHGEEGWELSFYKFRKGYPDLAVFVKRVKDDEKPKKG